MNQESDQQNSLSSPDRIAFASCNSQHYQTDSADSTIWPTILARNVSAFIWTGDSVYADDFYPSSSWFQFAMGRPEPKPATPDRILELYSQLLSSPGYGTFLEDVRNLTVLGAIDDHDYGCNNGDLTYPHKVESNQLFIDFLQSHQSRTNLTIMERRASQGLGVYGVKVLDFARKRTSFEYPILLSDEEAGIEPEMQPILSQHSRLSDRSVAIFLLDVRSNKTPWPSGPLNKYRLDYDGDFLGQTQWTWLETALSRSTARVNLIVNGLQVHADRYFNGNVVESWSRFPSSQHRLYQAIIKSEVKSPILLSGDVHMSEVLLRECRQKQTVASMKIPFPTKIRRRHLLEVTASGITHSWGSNICARPNSSIPCQSRNVARGLSIGMHWAHINGAWTDLVDTRDASIQHLVQSSDGTPEGIQYTLERNFGEFEFDWNQEQLLVRMFGHGVGEPLLSSVWKFDALTSAEPFVEDSSSSPLRSKDYASAWNDIASHGANINANDWICLNYRGQPSFLLKLYGVVTPILLAGSFISLPLLIPMFAAFLLLTVNRRRLANKSYLKLN